MKKVLDDWEIIPGAIISVAAILLSWVWWTIQGDVNSAAPSTPRIATALTAVVFIALLQTKRWKRKQQTNILRGLVHFMAFSITMMVFWDFWHWEHLDGAWYRETTLFTGRAAIAFIFLSLACTPLITLFGWGPLAILKKPLGNWGFGFVVLHLGLFAFDYGFVEGNILVGSVIDEALLKGYAVVGFIAFVLLIPLFLTSNKWSQKRLGKKWKRLHQLVYVIGVLAVAHYIWVWASKLVLVKPVAFALILAFLFLLRVDSVKKWVRAKKKQRRLAKA